MNAASPLLALGAFAVSATAADSASTEIDAPGVAADSYKVKVTKRKAGKVICEAAKTKVKVKKDL